MMNTTEVPDQGPSKTGHLPQWVVPIILTLAFLLIHVMAPWGLSLLSTRYGWVGGRPGPWNLLALILVLPGLIITIWMVTVHYHASPDTFSAFQQGRNLMALGPYAFSRNPMYLVEEVFWFGWALFYGSFTVLAGFLLVLVIFTFVLVPYEERELEQRFGETYRQYKQRIPRWLGKVRH